MDKKELIDFSRIRGYEKLLSDLENDPVRTLISLPRSVRLPFIASLASDLNRTILFVIPDTVFLI